VPEPPADLSDRIERLEGTIVELERRLATLEAGRGTREDAVLTEGAAADETVSADTPAFALNGPTTSTLTLVGRTSVALGGAFLLRALTVTDTGRMPLAIGISLGFLYALVWMAAAYRARQGRRASAFFHGLTALLIALPLVFESVARFEAAGTGTAAALLFLFATAGLVVSARQRLPWLAALIMLGTLVDAAALAVVTIEPVPFVFLACGLAIATETLAEPQHRSWMQWPIAFMANLLVLALVARAIGPAPLAPAASALVAVATFVVAYIWVIVHPMLARNRQLGVFDVLQALPLVLLGLPGLLAVAQTVSPAVGLVVTLLTLIAGAGCYAIGLGLSADRPHRLPAVHFFTSAGIAVVLVGTTSLLDGVVLTLLFAGLGFVFSWVGARRLQPTFLLHGAVYIIASAATLGFAGTLPSSWLLPVQAWMSLPPLIWLVAAAAALGVLGPRLAAGDFGGYLTIAARTTNAIVFTAVVATWLLLTSGEALSATPAPGPVAALRSAVLALSAITTAAAGRANRARAFGRLAYPLLALGAVKLLIEDFWYSGPVMIFVALACFGVALILTTRLRGRPSFDTSTKTGP
jgi:hypothetical protein